MLVRALINVNLMSKLRTGNAEFLIRRRVESAGDTRLDSPQKNRLEWKRRTRRADMLKIIVLLHEELNSNRKFPKGFLINFIDEFCQCFFLP